MASTPPPRSRCHPLPPDAVDRVESTPSGHQVRWSPPSGVHSRCGGARPRCARCGAVVRTRSGAVARCAHCRCGDAVGARTVREVVRTGAVVRCAARPGGAHRPGAVRPGAVRGPAAKEARPEPGSYITRPLDRDLPGVPNARYAGPCCATDHMPRGGGGVAGARRLPVGGGRAGRSSPVRARRLARAPRCGARRCAMASVRAPVRSEAVHRDRTVRTTGAGARTGCLDVPHPHRPGAPGWSPPDVTVDSTPLAPDRPPCPPSRRWGPPRPLTDGIPVSGWGPLPCADPAAPGAAAGGRGRPRPWPAASAARRPR